MPGAVDLQVGRGLLRLESEASSAPARGRGGAIGQGDGHDDGKGDEDDDKRPPRMASDQIGNEVKLAHGYHRIGETC